MELNETETTHEHATVSMKVVLLIFAVVLVGALGYLVWQQNTTTEVTDDSTPITKKANTTETTSNSQVKECDFESVNPTLKAGVTYDLGGGEEFDTLVCGYLTTKEENMAMEGDDVLIKNRAYLNVTKFADAKFKTALDGQISEGNTVNSSTAGVYQLGCGCYENNKIVSDTGDLTDPTSQVKLLASTATNPVLVKLSFQIHAGRGCTCCNLIDKLEVI